MNPSTLDIHGAAELMKVHTKTVLDMIETGVLPAAKIGRAYVMLTKDVMQHIENQIIRQTAGEKPVLPRPPGGSLTGSARDGAMNDFLPLDQADQLIAELAGERVFAGRSKRMAQAGKLKISFHYRGPIGVFAPPEKPDEKPRAIKKYSFNGHLCAVAQPVLDVPTEEISSEGIKELHIDYLIAREVTLAEGSLPIELEPGQFIGRLNTKIVHTDGNKRIRHAMDHLNSASVPERKWRIASDEIRAVFQKPTSTTTTPADGLGQGTKGKKRSRKPSWHSVSMKYMKDLYQSGNYKSSPAFYRALLLHVGKPNSPFAKTSGGALFCIEAGTEVAEGTVGTKWAEIRG